MTNVFLGFIIIILNLASDNCRFEIWSRISLKLEKLQNRVFTTVSIHFFISSASENGFMRLANICVTSYDAFVASSFLLVNRNINCFSEKITFFNSISFSSFILEWG